MPDYEDEESHTRPISQQPSFGAGIKRKRIEFVPQSRSLHSGAIAKTERESASVQDLYLSIVLPKQEKLLDTTKDRIAAEASAPTAPRSDTERADETSPREVEFCSICNLPLRESVHGLPHEASLSHQVCLDHSHPPSALDRRRKGLTYLSSYGWDPDGRKGLGASGEGRLYPVQAKKRSDKLGVGAADITKEAAPKVKALDACQARKLEKEYQKKGKRLQNLFYGRDDVNKHLGLEL